MENRAVNPLPKSKKIPFLLKNTLICQNLLNFENLRSKAGFSYIEVLMAMFILALALIPLLSQFYIGFQGNINAELVSQATDIGADLMEEIKSRRFDENLLPLLPVAPTSLGIDNGESANNRSTFDDVDDYKNWQKTPPQSINGAVLTDFPQFTQKAAVDYVTYSGTNWVTSVVAANYKRIIVTISHPKISDRKLQTIVSNY